MATLPTIHMNGTSAQELEEQYLRQLRAVNAAMEALQDTPPNGRDYYPQGDSAFEAARNEHTARRQQLFTMSQDIQTILEHIADAIEQRARQTRKGV